MKLIIDIDEELYKNVVEHTKEGYVGSDVWIAVAKGIPYEEKTQGEWINICTLPIIRKCSICGNEIGNEMGFYNNFCPNCGAELKGGAE